MKAIACPAIADTQSFEHDQRFVPSYSQFDRSLQSKVGFEATIGGHPVQDVLPIRPRVVRGCGSDSDGRGVGDRGHGRRLAGLEDGRLGAEIDASQDSTLSGLVKLAGLFLGQSDGAVPVRGSNSTVLGDING